MTPRARGAEAELLEGTGVDSIPAALPPLRSSRSDIEARQSDGTIDRGIAPGDLATILIALSDGLQVQAQFGLEAQPAESLNQLIAVLRPA